LRPFASVFAAAGLNPLWRVVSISMPIFG